MRKVRRAVSESHALPAVVHPSVGSLDGVVARPAGVVRSVGKVALLAFPAAKRKSRSREKLEQLTPKQVGSIYDAVAQHGVAVSDGAARILGEGSGSGLKAATDEAGRAVRAQVEAVLTESFRDPDVVSRLTAEVLNSVR